MDKDNRTLYDEALDRFRKDAAERHSASKDQELLNEFLQDKATPEETKRAAEALHAASGKKYGARKVGDVEIPESWVANIMANIENFVAAGDFVTKNAPESVGMAWYAVKLTLTAIHSNYDLYTFFGSGLSDISEIMIIVRHYDRLYDERSKPQWKPSPLVEKLFQDVIGAYAAVLDFSFAVKRHLTAGALTRIKHGFKDFFGISKAKFEDQLAAVARLKKKIIEESHGAFQDKTLSQLQGVSTVLAGIEGTVRHIQDFQDTQRKLHEDAMARFDELLRGLDDIRTSTKRKTQWEYAVQDFQTFQDALNPLEGSFRALGDTIDAVYPGTCQWLFEEHLYKRWRDSVDSAVLCITGSEGSGKSYVVASVADRITRAADPDKALLYVTCNGSMSGAGLGNSQSYTADSICRTFLSQLYDLAVQGEDNVGLLEACNAIFKKAKAKNNELPAHMRTDSEGLPEFADGFYRVAALLKKNVVLVLDGLDKNTLDNKNQEDLLRKVRRLLKAASERAGIRLHLLIGCASATKFFNDLDLAPDAYIDVQVENSRDIELVLTDALKAVPGLSAAEQETAKAAILDKARSRFLYVRDTAIPFMREPFQRPLSKRLEALPDGTGDVYSKALRRMSPNYLALLRTALTWTLLGTEFPGLPLAREVMDAFQGTYDVAPETDAENDGDVKAGFPPTSRLELEQLRGAIDPFIGLLPDPNGRVWLYTSDAAAVVEYFIKSDADVRVEQEGHEHLCVRCGSTAGGSPAKQLHIDPKHGHLQMALTCLRHLNNPLFQQRAGLLAGATEPVEDADTGDDSANEPTVDDRLQEAQDEYATEESIDGEDITEPQFYDEYMYSDDSASEPAEGSNDEGPARARYELQYWPWHIRNAEQSWPAEERENNSDWGTLMSELDKFVFETPAVFAAWQSTYPKIEDEDEDEGEDVFFGVSNKYRLFEVSNGPHKPLHVAAFLGLVSWTRHLLGRGEELNGLSKGFSPVQAAACSGRPPDTVKLLLEEGADVNAENEVGRTAFHHYLRRGDITIGGVRMFLEHGANPSASCSAVHHNALQYFAMRGEDPEILHLLLEHGADINAIHPDDDWQFPPLHVLLIRPEVPGPLLEAFVKCNADTNWENVASARPLQMVCSNGQLENLKILLQSEVLEIDDTDLHGTTAVHEAAFYNYSKCVAAVLEHGADPDIADKLNRIALHTAGRKGLVDAVRVLLQYTKQVNLLDTHGWSPLFCACLGKEEEAASLILDALIERDLPLAEINKPTRSGRTVLRQAADHGFDKVVSKLIQLASDDPASLALNAQDTKKGMTALHRAAMNGHAACVAALLAAGADVTLLDNQGSRPALALAHEQWSVATKKTAAYEDILARLIAADPARAVADADLVAVCAANGSVPLLAQLGGLSAPLNRPDRFGWTPLELARRFGRTEAQAFLKRQAAWAGLLPSRWERRFPGTTPVGAASVSVEGDGRRVLHVSGKRVCVSADRPLPAGLEGYYFEVTLVEVVWPAGRPEGGGEEEGRKRKKEWPEMAVGFCTLGGAALEFPGWWATSDSLTTARSWGYHSDTGGVYSSVEDPDDEIVHAVVDELKYKVGDTVGCGVDLSKGEIWFTKNGVKLDTVVKGVEGRLFPVVGLHDAVSFETNFGREGEGEFKWRPEVGGEVKEVHEEAVVEVVIRGVEKLAGVQVTSEEVVVGA
ncbi:ankyrin-3 [Chaetomidium leptoderma]|uniref:Ankyrin-3 n=1 Tax=Chaetomidium leptoderma TaxID=669021 RepID=A0AAN6ZSC0_9PEZI|nr:ankyrin-3 [Chaetomidium leptoderma]